jgi:TRAP-type C4-dicarboxylate transport system permease small subunit
MKLIRSLDAILARAETILLVTFLGAMVVMAFLQVVLRNVFGTGLLWGDTLVRHMLLWAGFLGGALAAFEERHISIDALTKYLSPRLKHAAALLTNVFAAVVCYELAQAAWTFLRDEISAGGEFILSLPGWAAVVIIPIGYVLLMLHFLLKVFEHASGVVAPDPKGGH